MPATVALFVGLDYSQHAVQVCVLDPQNKVLGNCAVPDSADALDQAVRHLGVVQGAALEACTGAADFAEESPTASAGRGTWPTPASSRA